MALSVEEQTIIDNLHVLIQRQSGDFEAIAAEIDAHLEVVKKDEEIWLHVLNARENREKLLQKLLAIGVDVNSRNWRGGALEKAIDRDDSDSIRTLIAAGADLNVPNSRTELLLNQAVQRGQIAIVQAVLEGKSIDINAVNVYGISALYYAEYSKNQVIFDFLISKGATIDPKTRELRDQNAQTKLYEAINRKIILMRKKLLQWGWM